MSGEVKVLGELHFDAQDASVEVEIERCERFDHQNMCRLDQFFRLSLAEPDPHGDCVQIRLTMGEAIRLHSFIERWLEVKT